MNFCRFFVVFIFIFFLKIDNINSQPDVCSCSSYTDGNGNPLINVCSPDTDCPYTTYIDGDISTPCCQIDPNPPANIPVNFNSGWIILFGGLLVATFYYFDRVKR